MSRIVEYNPKIIDRIKSVCSSSWKHKSGAMKSAIHPWSHNGRKILPYCVQWSCPVTDFYLYTRRLELTLVFILVKLVNCVWRSDFGMYSEISRWEATVTICLWKTYLQPTKYNRPIKSFQASWVAEPRFENKMSIRKLWREARFWFSRRMLVSEHSVAFHGWISVSFLNAENKWSKAY